MVIYFTKTTNLKRVVTSKHSLPAKFYLHYHFQRQKLDETEYIKIEKCIIVKVERKLLLQNM